MIDTQIVQIAHPIITGFWLAIGFALSGLLLMVSLFLVASVAKILLPKILLQRKINKLTGKGKKRR